MRLNPEKINSLLEAQYHYFASGQPEQAATVVDKLMRPLYALGRYPELLNLVEKTIESVEEPDNRFYIYQARALMALGRPDEALSILELVQYEIEDQELKAALLIDKGASLRRLGQFSRAEEIIHDYQEAFGIYGELAAESEDKELRTLFKENQGTCLFGEGNIYQYFLADPDTAMKEYAQARAIFEEVKSADGIADATKQMGEIHASPQFPAFYSPERANEFFQQALATHRENNYQKGVLETLYQLGRLHRAEPKEALKFFGEYLELAKSLGLIREQAIAKRHLAEVRFEMIQREQRDQVNLEPDYSSVIELISEAIPVLRLFTNDIWSQRALVNCCYLLGEVLMVLRDDVRALEAFKLGLRISHEEIFESRQTSDVRRRVRMLRKIADLLSRTDYPSEAEALLAEHADEFRQLELPPPSREHVEE